MKTSQSNTLLIGAAGLAFLLFATDQTKKITTTHQTIHSSNFKGNADFIKKMFPYALQAQKITGIPAIVILTFAAIESAWGQHAPGNNFFGLKAGSAWKGAIQLLKTFECGKTGNAKTDHITDQIISIHAPNSAGANAACSKKGFYTYRVIGKFRAFPTPIEGFVGFTQFIKGNHIYANSLHYLNNPLQMGLEILKAGYATAPAYQELFKQVMGYVAKNMPI